MLQSDLAEFDIAVSQGIAMLGWPISEKVSLEAVTSDAYAIRCDFPIAQDTV